MEKGKRKTKEIERERRKTINILTIHTERVLVATLRVYYVFC